VSIETHIDVLSIVIAAIVPGEPRPLDVGRLSTLDRHSAVSDAAAMGLDSFLYMVTVINRATSAMPDFVWHSKSERSDPNAAIPSRLCAEYAI
jgi:hypothetical protein